MIHRIVNNTNIAATNRVASAPAANAAKGTTAASTFGELMSRQLTTSDRTGGASKNVPDLVSPPSTTPATSTPSATASTGTQTTVHTPFGDVKVDSSTTTDLKAVFSGVPLPSPPAAAIPAANQIPTAQSVFGAQPWVEKPTGNIGGLTYGYNPIYFATPATAAKVAQMLGGTVVSQNAMAPNGTFQQSTPNLMVKTADGKLVNPGLIADFYNHGYPQYYVDHMIQAEVAGAPMARQT